MILAAAPLSALVAKATEGFYSSPVKWQGLYCAAIATRNSDSQIKCLAVFVFFAVLMLSSCLPMPVGLCVKQLAWKLTYLEYRPGFKINFLYI